MDCTQQDVKNLPSLVPLISTRISPPSHTYGSIANILVSCDQLRQLIKKLRLAECRTQQDNCCFSRANARAVNWLPVGLVPKSQLVHCCHADTRIQQFKIHPFVRSSVFSSSFCIFVFQRLPSTVPLCCSIFWRIKKKKGVFRQGFFDFI